MIVTTGDVQSTNPWHTIKVAYSSERANFLSY
jgi:hypothetical protein